MGGGSTQANKARAEEEEEEEAVVAPVDTSPADIAEMLPSLPTGMGFPPILLRRYRGFWLTEACLMALGPTHARFNPRPTDVFLTSFPKSGTTWLKALAFCVLNRTAHPAQSAGHPLHRGNPHDLVGFLETNLELNYSGPGEDELYGHLPSPRLLASHLPYSLLPHGIVTSGCKIVYVCRDPKDTLVSFWHFYDKTKALLQQTRGFLPSPAMETFEEAFKLFCQGKSLWGPQWRHALDFWEASRRRGPDHVLFLRYEDMLRDPEGNLMKLATFMGCPFSPQEEAAGVVRDIVELCRLGRLKELEVNKSGTTFLGLSNSAFFRNGTAGDWNSCMTPTMAAQLDEIVAEALRGSGLTFGCSSNN